MTLSHPFPRFAFLTTLFLLFAFAIPALHARDSGLTRHAQIADDLVTNLKGVTENTYGKGRRSIDWTPGHCRARTVCSSFISLLFEHTYHWTDDDIKAWFGKTDPDAAAYYDAVAAEKGFHRLTKIDSLKRADIIAIQYNDASSDTGHVMMIDAPPTPREASAPIVPDTTQYEVTVVDSSASGHGPEDTRALGQGKYTGGIGRGKFRLYTASDGRIVGYAWSTSDKSTYYTTPERRLVVGRLIWGAKRDST